MQDYCRRSNFFALQAIKDTSPEVVLLAQSDEYDVAVLDAISIELRRSGVKKVVIAGPTPHWTAALPSIVIRNFFHHTPRRTYVGVDMAVIQKNEELRKHFRWHTQVVFADLIGTFCNPDGCLVFIGDDERNGITTYDYGHLTPSASEYLAKSLLVQLIVDSPDSQEAGNAGRR